MDLSEPRIAFVNHGIVENFQANDLLELVRAQGLVVVRDIHLNLDGFAALLSELGLVIEHPFLPKSLDSPGPTVLRRPRGDRVGDFIYGGAWHQNLSFLEHPPDITVLYSAQISSSRSFTAFVDLAEVAPWLSEGAVQLLKRSYAVHSTTAPDSPQNVMPKGIVRDSAGDLVQHATHASYLMDSVTGKSWPYVMSNYITCLDGWHPRESMPLVEALYKFASHDEFVIRHYWKECDLLLWDNRRFMHRATITHRDGERELWRGDLNLGWGLERFI